MLMKLTTGFEENALHDVYYGRPKMTKNKKNIYLKNVIESSISETGLSGHQ